MIMKRSLLLVASVLVFQSGSALADGCAPGQPCWEQFNKPRREVREPVSRKELMEKPVVREEAAVEIPAIKAARVKTNPPLCFPFPFPE